MLHPFGKQLSVLILDYCRPDCGKILLESLKEYLKVDSDIIYLVNGAQDPEEYEYAFDFFRAGLIDELIIKKRGDGGGMGHCDLTRWCKTPYFCFVQVDHKLIRDITEKELEFFISLIEQDKYKTIDLNGDQSNKGIWTDRAHLMSTSFFNSLDVSTLAGGGPGIFQDSLKWNEEYLQEAFSKNSYQIAHISPLFFADAGKESYREYPCGAKTLHFTDEKKLFILKPFKRKYQNGWLKLNEEEWELALSGNWPKDGLIPEAYRDSSFIYW